MYDRYVKQSADENKSRKFKPVYKKKTFLQKLPGRAARTVLTPLMGLAGAGAGGIGLGLGGALLGGYLGHRLAPNSTFPAINPQPSIYLHKYLGDTFGSLMSQAGNALGGPHKLMGTGAGSLSGAALGGLTGLVGGGLGGGYLGYRMGGGGKSPEIDHFVADDDETDTDVKSKKANWFPIPVSRLLLSGTGGYLGASAAKASDEDEKRRKAESFEVADSDSDTVPLDEMMARYQDYLTRKHINPSQLQIRSSGRSRTDKGLKMRDKKANETLGYNDAGASMGSTGSMGGTSSASGLSGLSGLSIGGMASSLPQAPVGNMGVNMPMSQMKMANAFGTKAGAAAAQQRFYELFKQAAAAKPMLDNPVHLEPPVTSIAKPVSLASRDSNFGGVGAGIAKTNSPGTGGMARPGGGMALGKPAVGQGVAKGGPSPSGLAGKFGPEYEEVERRGMGPGGPIPATRVKDVGGYGKGPYASGRDTSGARDRRFLLRRGDSAPWTRKGQGLEPLPVPFNDPERARRRELAFNNSDFDRSPLHDFPGVESTLKGMVPGHNIAEIIRSLSGR